MTKRNERILRKRFIVFCEGNTEYNYIDCMRKKQGVEVVLKPINMGGGGYANFLKKVKTDPQSNCLAKFIIVDADLLVAISGELSHFNQLLNYCTAQNQKGNVPHFLIVNNPNFEYVACLHSPDYMGQETHKFLKDVLGLKNVDSFKSDENVYDILNRVPMSYQVMLNAVRKNKKKIVQNLYEVKKKTFDITIKKTVVDMNMRSLKGSNIEEFFDVIDW